MVGVIFNRCNGRCLFESIQSRHYNDSVYVDYHVPSAIASEGVSRAGGLQLEKVSLIRR